MITKKVLTITIDKDLWDILDKKSNKGLINKSKFTNALLRKVLLPEEAVDLRQFEKVPNAIEVAKEVVELDLLAQLEQML